MTEINHCGRCAECCTDVNFTVTREQREQDFYKAQEVDDLLALTAMGIQDSGSYAYSYYKHGSALQKAVILMNGKCFHYNNGCTIYEKRPEDCKKFQRGGKSCNEMREFAGLIKMENIEIINEDDTINSDEI